MTLFIEPNGRFYFLWLGENRENAQVQNVRMEFVDESIVSICTVTVKSGTERKVAHT